MPDNDQDAFEFSTKVDQALDGMNLTGWFLYSDIENNLISDGTSAAFGFYNNDPVCQQTVTELSGYPLLPPQFIGASPEGVIFNPNGSFLGAYTPTTCDGIQEQVRNQKDYSFELRLALGLARSFASSTRFILDQTLAAAMFLRARYLLELALATNPDKPHKFRLPIQEIFVG